MKKFRLITLLVIILSLSLCIFTACSKDDDNEDMEASGADFPSSSDVQEDDDYDYDHPEYANEDEEAVVTEQKSAQEKFYGKWIAKSDRAEYLYGNIEITINPNGTWTGNITDENHNGKWKYNGTGLTLASEWINCDLFFAQDGNLMFRDKDAPEDLIVLFSK